MACKRCVNGVKFHSFDYITDISGIKFFYCFPAHNVDSVKTREDMLNFVSHFPQEDVKWSVVFHANGYGLSHMMPIDVAIEMGKLCQQLHLKKLQKVYIIQGSWLMEFCIRCVFPFLNKEMREKFVLINGSLLEVMMNLRETGLKIHQLKELRNNF